MPAVVQADADDFARARHRRQQLRLVERAEARPFGYAPRVTAARHQEGGQVRKNLSINLGLVDIIALHDSHHSGGISRHTGNAHGGTSRSGVQPARSSSARGRSMIARRTARLPVHPHVREDHEHRAINGGCDAVPAPGDSDHISRQVEELVSGSGGVPAGRTAAASHDSGAVPWLRLVSAFAACMQIVDGIV